MPIKFKTVFDTTTYTQRAGFTIGFQYYSRIYENRLGKKTTDPKHEAKYRLCSIAIIELQLPKLPLITLLTDLRQQT